MKKYIVSEGMNKFLSESRNAKKHIQDGGYNKVSVYELNGKKVSEAARWDDGNIANVNFEPEVNNDIVEWYKSR